MTDTQIIWRIRQSRSLERLWGKLTESGKRRVLAIAAGDDFMLDTIVTDIYDDEVSDRANDHLNSV